MTIVDQLSSQVGDRTEASNRAVAQVCLADPAHLADIAAGLASGDRRLAGDCAEVLTLVSQTDPKLVAPYADRLVPLLDHPYSRARWEATHALASLTTTVPGTIGRLLPKLASLIRRDPSTIVRDHATKMVATYASLGPAEAEGAYPTLMEALAVRGGKHAHHALPGLGSVADFHPAHRASIRAAVEPLLRHPRRVVQQGARHLLRSLDG